jgi:hypothetical protein
MCNRVYNFLEKNHVLDDSQYGFRKNRSTALAVSNYIQGILETINNKRHAVGLLLDLAKAYDRVSHKILLNKLYGSGIRGIAHDWFGSYLENRTQIVQTEYLNPSSYVRESVRSDIIEVRGSIPQCSVLACLLFLVYINDLSKEIDTKCIMFADDVSLLFYFNINDNFNTKLSIGWEITISP